MVGEKMKSLRQQRGISMSRLAEMAGCSKSYLSDIERGKRDNPSIHFLEKIAVVFDVPVLYFIDLDNVTEFANEEWLSLLVELQRSGITKEQLRQFIRHFQDHD